IAAELRPLLDDIDGFISIGRFESLSNPGKVRSPSFWRDEDAVRGWRSMSERRGAQHAGRNGMFRGYRRRVAGVVRGIGRTGRDDAPVDSRAGHDTATGPV